MNKVKYKLGLWLLRCFLFGSLSFTVNANTLEGLNDTIRFQGSVISPEPVWAWQIHLGAADWARDLNISAQQGVVNGQFVTFSYVDGSSSRRSAFLQGFMKSPSANGHPSITPIVSVTDKYNQRIVLSGNTERQEVEFKAIGDSGNVVGSMLLSLESAYAVFYKRTGEPGSYYRTWLGDSSGIGFAAVSVIIENQSELHDYYPNSLNRIDVRQNTHYDMTSLLSGTLMPDAVDLLGGFTSHMSSVKTVWPRNHIPSTWQANLTVDVRIP